jgi:uncharacterized protein YbaA (DUF1428 family)
MERKFETKIKNAAAEEEEEPKNPITAAEIETGSYMDLSFSRAPKRNHDALAQIGKQFVQWLKKHGVKAEIYHLSSSAYEEVPSPEGLESIAKTLSIGDDEEVWVALQFYRDQAHAAEVRSKMMQDKSLGAIMKEFDGLVSQGKSLITDGFSRLGA